MRSNRSTPVSPLKSSRPSFALYDRLSPPASGSGYPELESALAGGLLLSQNRLHQFAILVTVYLFYAWQNTLYSHSPFPPIDHRALPELAVLANYAVNLVDGTFTVTPVVSNQPTIFVLDGTAKGALSISGQASVRTSGAVMVDSNASNAIQANNRPGDRIGNRRRGQLSQVAKRFASTDSDHRGGGHARSDYRPAGSHQQRPRRSSCLRLVRTR